MDESTDVDSQAQLISFVRYIEEGNFKTEFLFCKPLQTTAKAEDIFDIINDYFCANEIDWSHLTFCTTDGAPAMMGKRTGGLTQIKRVAPTCMGNHCCLHRQVLSSKTMPPELATVFNEVQVVINFVKSSATNTRLFKRLCEENEAETFRLLFFTAVRWLSRGNGFPRVFELRSQLADFLDSKNHRLAQSFRNDDFIAKLGYLADIFASLNMINKSLQGQGTVNVFEAINKLSAFCGAALL